MNPIVSSSQGLTGVAETLLMPLYMRAMESLRPDAIIRDDRALELFRRIDYDLSRFIFDPDDQAVLCLRNRQFDRFAKDYLYRFPDSVIVHIGCGLDCRFERLDNGKAEWYDLDLPDVMELRRKLVGGEQARYHLLACSVLDNVWRQAVSLHGPKPFLFLAEGVLQYFEEAQVKSLILTLQEDFPNAELICDAITPYVVSITNAKHESTGLPPVRWGIETSKDVENWGLGIRLLDEWYYLDRAEPRLHDLALMVNDNPELAKASGVFHYRLGGKTIDAICDGAKQRDL